MGVAIIGELGSLAFGINCAPVAGIRHLLPHEIRPTNTRTRFSLATLLVVHAQTKVKLMSEQQYRYSIVEVFRKRCTICRPCWKGSVWTRPPRERKRERERGSLSTRPCVKVPPGIWLQLKLLHSVKDDLVQNKFLLQQLDCSRTALSRLRRAQFCAEDTNSSPLGCGGKALSMGYICWGQR